MQAYMVLIFFLLAMISGCDQRGNKNENPTIAKNIIFLKAGNKNQKMQAAEKLGEIGEEAVPALREVLKNGKIEARRYAALALEEMGPKAIGAAPELIKALTDEDRTLKEQAGLALGEIGPAVAKDAVPVLIKILKEPKGKKIAIITLGKMEEGAKEAVDHLIPLLESSEQRQVIHVAETLGKIKSGKAIPALVEAKKKYQHTLFVSSAISSALTDIRMVHPVPYKVKKTSTKKTKPVEITEKDKKEIALQVKILQENKPKEGDGQTELWEKFESRNAALNELIYMKKKAISAIPTFIELLQNDSQDTIKAAAADALGYLGKEAYSAVPILLKALKKEEKMVKESAALAIVYIDFAKSEQALPIIFKMLDDDSEMLKHLSREKLSAIRALGKFGPLAAAKVPILTTIFQEVHKAQERDCEKICRIIVEVLGDIGPASSTAIPVIIENSFLWDQESREMVMTAIEKMGDKGVPVLEKILAQARKDGDKHAIGNALEALTRLKNKNAKK